MNSWMGFCLYVAAGVFIQDQRSDEVHSQSITNLEFLLAAMKAIGNRHSITNHFTAQLELDIASSGIKIGRMPNIPMNGIIPSRGGAPMSVEDLRTFWEPSYTNENGSVQVQEVCQYMSNMGKGNQFFGVIPRKPEAAEKVVHLPPEGLRDKHVHPSYPNWDPPASSALSNPDHNTQSKQQKQAPFETSSFAQSDPPVPTEPNVATTGGSPFNIDSFLAGNTPSSDSSSSRTMQMPYRQAGSSNHQSPDYSMFQASDPSSFLTASDWTSDMPLSAEQFDGVFGNPRNPQGPQATDAARQFFGTESWGENPTPPGG